jgi:hypothetical protein
MWQVRSLLLGYKPDSSLLALRCDILTGPFTDETSVTSEQWCHVTMKTRAFATGNLILPGKAT